jgi:hypothetical protein
MCNTIPAAPNWWIQLSEDWVTTHNERFPDKPMDQPWLMIIGWGVDVEDDRVWAITPDGLYSDDEETRFTFFHGIHIVKPWEVAGLPDG